MDDFVKTLQNADFVIVSFATKTEFLKLRNRYPWLRAKIVTKAEVIKDFLGEPSALSHKRLIEKYNYAYPYAKVLNANLIFPNPSTQTPKTTLLSELRSDLLSEGFLLSVKLAHQIYGGKRFFLAPEFQDDVLLLALLNSVKVNLNFLPTLNTYKHEVVTYETGIDELYATLNTISELLSSGVSAKQIKVVRPNDKYLKLLYHLGKQFNLHFMSEDYSLYDYPEVRAFLLEYAGDETLLREALEAISPGSNELLTRLKTLYLNIHENEVPRHHFTKYFVDLVHATLVNEGGIEGISLIRELPLFSVHDDYFFYLNFAEGSAPSRHGANPFLTNEEKSLLGLNTNEITAKCAEDALIYALSNLKNVFISFSPLLSDEGYDRSSLVDKLNYEVRTGRLPDTVYSAYYLTYLTSIRRDELEQYNIIDDDLVFLYAVDENRRDYKSFDYTFKGINYEHSKINLSYSALELYHNLPFDYFAHYLLDLKDDAHNESINYGNFVHKVLEHSHDDESFKFAFGQYLDQGDFSAKEKFFINNTKEIVYLAYAFFEDYKSSVAPIAIYNEEKLAVKFNDRHAFNGRVDRLLVFENEGQKIGIIVDFKTGGAVVKPSHFPYGLNLQLPIYGVLLQEDPRFKDVTPAAFVINSLKLESYVLSDEERLLEAARKSLKFKGLVRGDPLLLPWIDSTYEKSEYFNQLGFNAKGELTGVVSPELFDEYITLAHNTILETIHLIENNIFPVRIVFPDGKPSGTYSPFKEISYLPRYQDDDEEDYYDED